MVVDKGYKQTEVGVIPVAWEVTSIENCVESNGLIRGPFGGALKKEFFVKKGYKVYEQKNAIYKSIELGEYYIDKTKFIELNRFSINGGDFIVSCSGTIGRIYLIPKNYEAGVINQALLIIRIDESKCNKKYFEHYFSSIWFQNKITDSTQGGAMKNMVGMKEFKMSTFPLPPLPEQTAIANALSDMDALIAQTEKLIEKKKAIKQGVMQELLKPKEGWVTVKIREIAKVGRGRVISQNEIAKSINKSYPVYSSQTSNNGVMGYIDTYDFEGEYITWTTDGEKAGTVFHRKGRFNCTNVCGTIKLKDGNPRFIHYILAIEAPKHVSRNLANPKLMNEPMKNIEIIIPENIDVQNFISDTIFDMEMDINLIETKLQKLKNQKQGMMQALLTGKIRLI